MLDFLFALLNVFVSIWDADKSLSENSRVGESRWDREARESWVRYGVGCFVLLLLAACIGTAAWLWS